MRDHALSFLRRCGGAAAALCLCAPAAAQDTDPSPPQPAGAAAEIVERCRGPEYRAFDFRLGDWEVRNAEGDVIGHNTITRVSGGCALLEDWRGSAGGVGMSINAWDADRARWTQRWVGAGSVLWLEGRLEGGAMVLSGTAPRMTTRGPVLDRITWTPLPDGRVRQVWDVSTDDGESWVRSFVGFYAAASP